METPAEAKGKMAPLTWKCEKGLASHPERGHWTPHVHSLLLLLPLWRQGAVAVVRRDVLERATVLGKTDMPEPTPDFNSQLPSEVTPWPTCTWLSASPPCGKKQLCAPSSTVGNLTKHLNPALEYRMKIRPSKKLLLARVALCSHPQSCFT